MSRWQNSLAASHVQPGIRQVHCKTTLVFDHFLELLRFTLADDKPFDLPEDLYFSEDGGLFY